MAGNFDVDVIYGEGRDLVPRLRISAKNSDKVTRDALRDLARYAENRMRFHAPKSSRPGGGHLARSIKAGNLTPQTAASAFQPGGGSTGRPFQAGGGYEINVRVGARYGNLVQRGTGVHGPSGQKIYAGQGNLIFFQKQGEGKRFVKWTRGQEAQDFLGEAARDLEPLVVLKAEEMAAEIRALLT